MKEIIEPKYHISFSELEEKLGIEKGSIVKVIDKNQDSSYKSGEIVVVCKKVEKDV